ncbi:MAG: hypothetical protein CMM76_15055 [Rhodospirillaceae bacterium]|nr:hypothetical protein [Rhodospirillaceae bacterium]|tara:strand:+ start:201 stop:413 length:213 start_codon:yes stop_codon:yes gene_type:complete
MNTLDQLGVPGLMVATTEFKPAAAAQSKSLGFEPEIIWVDHPIQNRTEDELKEIAYDAFPTIIETLKGNA